ncbi:hypothetical protein GpartN1_g5477.t1 [Galdieria partita]|uniref:Uncharacterized protein n=1 Tax=Galdieria partita TaxID=83374 RepID=A0A9C7PZZ2_9RHOD|nr:hypothetical protein GpartN1_g5477.t1 [Galdieria partita]
MVEFSSHIWWTEKFSARICKYLKTKEQIKEETKTPFHLDIVILLTPFCSVLEDHYPPRSGFHSILDATTSVLKQLGSLVDSKSLYSIQSLVVFEHRGILCCQTLSGLETRDVEGWQKFEKESLTLLEQEIEQVYIPYLQSRTHWNQDGIDLYDLLVLDCIHGGNMELETTAKVFRRMMLITSSPSMIKSSYHKENDKNAAKFLTRKGMALDLVHVLCDGLVEPIPSSVVAYCLLSGGNIWNSNNIIQLSSSSISSNQKNSAMNERSEEIGFSPMNHSLQDIFGKWFSHENSVIATSEQWKFSGNNLGVFIQWHIQQGFRPNFEFLVHSQSRMGSGSLEESYLSFYLLLNECLLVICHIHIYTNDACLDTESLECVASSHHKEEDDQQMVFLVQLELRERKENDEIVNRHYSFDRWLSLLACEQLLFDLSTNPTSIAFLSQRYNDWWKECPCLIFHILKKPTVSDSLDVQQVEEFLLSLYPGSTCSNHLFVFHIDQSQYLLFYLIPTYPSNNGVKVIFVGIGICVHEWNYYLDPLFMHYEWNLWSHHLEPSCACSFFLLESESLGSDIESLHFSCSRSHQLRIQLWGNANHCWILPTGKAAHRVFQSLRLHLKTMGWSTLREEQEGNVSVSNRMMTNAKSWWIGASYPLVIGLERERNQVKLYYHHRISGKEPLLDVASYTAVACYHAMDAVLDWWKVDEQQMLDKTKRIVKIDNSIWHFAHVVYDAKVKSRLFEFFQVRCVVFNSDWMIRTICELGDWMPIENNYDMNKIVDAVVGEHSMMSKCLTFAKKVDWNDRSAQLEWLMGMFVVWSSQEDSISLFILSLQPVQWLSQQHLAIIQRASRYHGSKVVQQIKRNIFWNSIKVENENFAQLWKEETMHWKSVRWSLDPFVSSENSQNVLFCSSNSCVIHYALKWLIEMLSNIGYHKVVFDDDRTTWLKFQYKKENNEQLRVVAKVYCDDIQVWLELYNMAPKSWHSRMWKNWILCHEWIMRILGKYLLLCFNNDCYFSSWVLLDDMSAFCEDCLKYISSGYQLSSGETKVVEWSQQNVWLLQWNHSDLCLEVHVREQQEWPLQCVLSFNDVSKATNWENIAVSQLFWSALTIQYLQGKYLIQRWNQLNIPMENNVVLLKWLLDEKNVNECDQRMLFQFRSIQLEWKYKEISKMDFIDEWKRQLGEQQVELYVHENPHKLTCVGLSSVNKLNKGIPPTDETRDNWIIFALEVPHWKSNDSSIVAKTMSLPLKVLYEFLCQTKRDDQIIEWLQKMEQIGEESQTWLSTWFSSVLFQLHQLQRWKTEIAICRNASSWNRHLFMDTFPHYSFSELCRTHFANLNYNLVKMPKLPPRNHLEWDKIINPTSAAFSETFQLLRRNQLEDNHVWYLLMSSQYDDVMLLLHLPLKEEPNLELIMQSTDKITYALRLGCQFLRWLIRQVWNQCWEKRHDLQAKLN